MSNTRKLMSNQWSFIEDKPSDLFWILGRLRQIVEDNKIMHPELDDAIRKLEVICEINHD
jgi:hypothetical protein